MKRQRPSGKAAASGLESEPDTVAGDNTPSPPNPLVAIIHGGDEPAEDLEAALAVTQPPNPPALKKASQQRSSGTAAATVATTAASSIIVNFTDKDGQSAGPPMDLPISTSLKQLEMLINTLVAAAPGKEDTANSSVPYAFYIHDVEVVSSLEATLLELQTSGRLPGGASYEDALAISYQPLSVFKVRPVTRCMETMPGHTDAVLHVAYSPDGKRLASGGGDTTVRFWNTTTCTPAQTCQGHRNHVLCTTWSPDGKWFVSADKSGEIRVWDGKTGTAHGRPLTGHKKWVTGLVFEPMHIDPNCIRFASSSKDSTVRIWHILTGNCECTISGHTDSIEAVRWGGTGLLYTASRDRTIKVWAVDGHARNKHLLVRTLTGHGHRINTLALNCDYVLRTGAFELGKDYPTTLEGIQALARERYLAVVGAEQEEKLVSGSDDFTLFMWTPQSAKQPVVRLTGHQQLVNHIAFSPDGRYFASASFDKKVKVWCGKTGRFLATLTGHVGAVYQVAWSMNSQFLVSASKDSTMKLWDIKAPKTALHTLPGHADEVYSLDWSPNGSQVATGSKDRTIKIWHH